jgi:hypothetical protein
MVVVTDADTAATVTAVAEVAEARTGVVASLATVVIVTGAGATSSLAAVAEVAVARTDAGDTEGVTAFDPTSGEE